jgi:hypothetical protein
MVLNFFFEVGCLHAGVKRWTHVLLLVTMWPRNLGRGEVCWNGAWSSQVEVASWQAVWQQRVNLKNRQQRGICGGPDTWGQMGDMWKMTVCQIAVSANISVSTAHIIHSVLGYYKVAVSKMGAQAIECRRESIMNGPHSYTHGTLLEEMSQSWC